MKKNKKRLSASYIRKFLPSLRRISTGEGRWWTVDGTICFGSLQNVVEFYSHKGAADKVKQSALADMLNEGAEKGVDDVATN